MNKKAKIAMAAVSFAMASTMAVSIVGCSTTTNSGTTTNKNTTSAKEIVTQLNSVANLTTVIANKNSAWQRLKTYADDGYTTTATSTQTKLTPKTDSEGKLSYSSSTQIRFDVGDKNTRSISYGTGSLISGTVTLPDGKTYTNTSLKPAWAALETELNVDIQDVWTVASSKVQTAMSSTTETKRLQDIDIITDGAKTINDNAKNDDGTYNFLDLSLYLDYMPNYKAFLEENPVVRLSLTSDTTTGAMYVAPYFDGYDDIEKYDLFKTNWVKALLDNTSGGSDTTWAEAMTAKEKTSTSASIESYMGTTGSWKVDVLDKDGVAQTSGIRVDYDLALAAAKNESASLGAAVKAAAGKAYSDGSGNIVDIMNFAINSSEGKVTGAQLLTIVQEYIKVAYYVGETSTPFYTRSGYNLSDVFVGNSAAWDVDLYAALGRCLVTNPTLIHSGSKGNTIGGEGATTLANLYLCAARQSNMQRMVDVTGLVGELYGLRGIESKNIYSYIDADGDLQDVRGDYESYEAFEAFSKFYAEGLVYAGGGSSNGDITWYAETTAETLSFHDYVNTQTPAGYQIDGTIASGTYNIEAGYYLTPVITAVSKWNTKSTYDSDNNPVDTEYMRMVDSWRSVKDSGFAVPYAAVANDPEKLAAVLTFIDYLFSDDGQIAMTYGPMASDENGTGGFWYNRIATADEIAAGTYFTYKGQKYYSETVYSGKYVPTVTTKVMSLYVGKVVNDFSVADKDHGFSQTCARSYTDFARYVLGTALPLGNKLESFEYQMTSDMGRSGAAIVDAALSAGVIRHPYNTLTNKYNNPWYTVVPSVLPFTDSEIDINTQNASVSDTGTGTYFSNNKNDSTNLYWEIIQYGYNASKYNASLLDSLNLTKN